MTNRTIRTMEAFVGTVKSAMEAYFGDEYKVQVNTVVKNNGLHLTGLTILNRSSNMAPTIYLEHYFELYKNGETMADVCQQIIRVYEYKKIRIEKHKGRCRIMSNFTVEEINLMCVFDAKGRTELIEDIGRVLPHLDDKDMEELANRVIGKLQNMTDEEFAEVVLEAAE